MNAANRKHSIVTSSQRIESIKAIKKFEPFIFPKYCIMGFFPSLYGYIKQKYSYKILNFINPNHPYYLFSAHDQNFAFIVPGIGAPCAGMILDESIALGAEVILFLGFAGIFNNADKNKLILPTGAVSDEGTSKHYLQNKPIVEPDHSLISEIESLFDEKKIPFSKGLTWTTDAPYRETPEKIRQKKSQGCIAVDMEASALFSIAQYYDKKIADLFLPSDFVSENEWVIFPSSQHHKELQPSRLFELGIELMWKYHKKIHDHAHSNNRINMTPIGPT